MAVWMNVGSSMSVSAYVCLDGRWALSSGQRLTIKRLRAVPAIDYIRILGIGLELACNGG